MDIRNLKKEIKEQRTSEGKEFLTIEIGKDGGLILCQGDLELISDIENEILIKLQRQIKFRLRLGEKSKDKNTKNLVWRL